MLTTLEVSDGTKIANVYVADTFIKKLFGYMFRKKPHYQAILFKNCNSIHTFFMRFPINVIFLDEDYQAIKNVNALQPGHVLLPVKGACSTLEIFVKTNQSVIY